MTREHEQWLLLAREIDKQADALRERAIKAEVERRPEAVEWGRSFATSYQTLRGLASAIFNFVGEPRA